MRKLILHNLSIPYAHSSFGLYDFDQNGLFFAYPDDIVVTRSPISEKYLSFLAQYGLDFSSVTFLSSKKDLLHDPYSIFADEDILTRISSINVGESTLDSFLLSEHERQWSGKLGVLVEGNAEHYYHYGNKSFFRTLSKKKGFPVATGFENQTSIIDCVLRASALFLLGFSEIVIKQDEGVASIGSQRFTRNEFLSNFLSFRRSLSELVVNGIVSEYSSSFVIERWYEDVDFSPSIQFYITKEGKVELVSMHIQIFYENKMRYRGCFSEHWLPENIRLILVEEGQKFAKVLAEQGYRGHVGFNTIILKSGKLLWTEINARRVMSLYPFQIRRRLFRGEENAVYYISKQMEKEAWKGKTIEYILEILSPILFTHEKKHGIVPFDYGLLRSCGQLSLVCFGYNKNIVKELSDYVEAL